MSGANIKIHHIVSELQSIGSMLDENIPVLNEEVPTIFLENNSECIPLLSDIAVSSGVIVGNKREKLVDDIIKSALPRIENLLREIVQEALLKEKLQRGKR